MNYQFIRSHKNKFDLHLLGPSYLSFVDPELANGRSIYVNKVLVVKNLSKGSMSHKQGTRGDKSAPKILCQPLVFTEKGLRYLPSLRGAP